MRAGEPEKGRPVHMVAHSLSRRRRRVVWPMRKPRLTERPGAQGHGPGLRQVQSLDLHVLRASNGHRSLRNPHRCHLGLYGKNPLPPPHVPISGQGGGFSRLPGRRCGESVACLALYLPGASLLRGGGATEAQGLPCVWHLHPPLPSSLCPLPSSPALGPSL